jgi:hypothetical protein
MTSEAQKVGGWPRLQVEIRSEAQHVTAVLRINGAPQGCASSTVEGMRAGIIARCATLAATLSRPVAVDVDEAGQSYRIAVRPNGVVQSIDAGNTIADASRLTPVNGPCRQCQQLVVVTAASCGACGIDQPLRVELNDAPPRRPTHASTVPVDAPVEYRHTAAPLLEVDEHTVFVRAPRPQLVVLLDNGETITTPAPAVLGRNPDAIDGHTPVKLPSPGREVSRTHVLVDVDDAGRLIVTDHGSGNGTYVDGQALSPYTPTIIASSARLQLGDTYVQLQSRTDRAQPSTHG